MSGESHYFKENVTQGFDKECLVSPEPEGRTCNRCDRAADATAGGGIKEKLDAKIS